MKLKHCAIVAEIYLFVPRGSNRLKGLLKDLLLVYSRPEKIGWLILRKKLHAINFVKIKSDEKIAI